MKCAKCRRPTEWLFTQTRQIVCKRCKHPAPGTLNAYKCKHRFTDSNGTLSKNCNRNCKVMLDISDEELKKAQETHNNQQLTLNIST